MHLTSHSFFGGDSQPTKTKNGNHCCQFFSVVNCAGIGKLDTHHCIVCNFYSKIWPSHIGMGVFSESGETMVS